MKSALLRLEGPQQSWGLSSRFDERDTALEPTKSGVVGVCAAALGIQRSDVEQLRRLARLRMAVRVDRPGTLSFDYQTAGGGTFNGGRYGVRKADGGFGGTVVSRRSYLADASFLAALGGEDHDLVVEIDRALRNPHWPLFLGRRAFVPSTSVAAGIFDGAPESALSTVQALARGQKRVRMMVEVEADGLPRNDQPVSFVSDSRTYSTRLVADREIELP